MTRIKNIYDNILEISDVDFQKRAWLNNSKSECSSFTEVMCRLFDDDEFDRFIDVEINTLQFNSELVSQIKILRNMLNDYKEKSSDFEIIEDPDWQCITIQAKDIITLWNEMKLPR